MHFVISSKLLECGHCTFLNVVCRLFIDPLPLCSVLPITHQPHSFQESLFGFVSGRLRSSFPRPFFIMGIQSKDTIGSIFVVLLNGSLRTCKVYIVFSRFLISKLLIA